MSDDTASRAPAGSTSDGPRMPRGSSFGFTKLIVHDLDRMVAFYRDVHGLHPVNRRRGDSLVGEEIDEVMLSADPKASYGPLVLLRYLARGASPNGELILGFTSDDLPALLERVTRAGGRVVAPIQQLSDLRIRVAFATDPEGHLSELVQLVS